MTPVPTALKVGLLLLAIDPALMVNVVPVAAPMVTPTTAVLVMEPESVLLPLALKIPPVLLMPVGAPAPVAAILIFLEKVIPPSSQRAAPAPAAPGLRMT